MTAQLIELFPQAPQRPTIDPVTTNIRYEGSIPELRGRRGWVERVGHLHGELRYDISLTGIGGRAAVRLIQVSADSLVVD